jgi:succinyl-CoA synthetase beta subunit
MKIHEYQAKAILAKYDVPVPRGEVAFTVDEAEAAAKKIGGSVVVKAQIHAGGRGKGGGVKIAKDANEAAEIAKKMLGMKLVTHQTGPEGRIVQRLLVEETLPIERELYLGIVLDRAIGKPVFMASSAGGMEIEEVAAKSPELILKEALEPGYGLAAFQGRNLAFGMGVPAASTWPRSIPSFSPRTARSTRWTPRSRWMTTRCTGTKIFSTCATSMKKIRSKSRPRASA